MLNHANFPGVAGRFVGVDVFFVISGFLITGPLLADAADGVVSFSKFYSRRALRILPAATVVILATGVASLLILNSVRAKAVLADSLWASVFAANVKFGRDGTDYFSEAAVSPLQHFWSLAVEEQFYLVWPAVLALAVIGLPVLQARLGGESRPAATPGPVPRVRIALVLAVGGTASLLLSIRQTATDRPDRIFLRVPAAPGSWSPVPPRDRPAVTWAPTGHRALRPDLGRRRRDRHHGGGLRQDSPFPSSAAMLPVLATCAVLAGGIGAPS